MHKRTESMVGFIYLITNHANGMKYIGMKKYNKNWETYMSSSAHVKRAIQEFGIENFTRELIEECDNMTMLRNREIFWLKHHDIIHNPMFYNKNIGGTKFAPHEVMHPNTKKAIIRANTGKKRSQETKNKISNALQGKLKSPEHITNVRKAKKLKPHITKNRTFEETYGIERAAEIKLNMCAARKLNSTKGQSNLDRFGAERAAEISQKISIKTKGRIMSEEHKEKIRQSKLGKKRSEETKLKISQTKRQKNL